MYIFRINLLKNVHCMKKTKINEKEAEVGLFKNREFLRPRKRQILGPVSGTQSYKAFLAQILCFTIFKHFGWIWKFWASNQIAWEINVA